MKGWASKFHTTRRRLKQGLLERVGAAESSVDTKRDERQWARFHSLESSLHAVNDALRHHLTSLVGLCETGSECGVQLCGAVQRSAASGYSVPDECLRGTKELLRVYTRFQGVMRTSVHRVYADQVLKPTGEALSKLPELKQAMEQRRSATLDFDAYHRRVEALETKLTTHLSSKKAAKIEGELATEMAKLERAKAELDATNAKVEELFTNLEAAQAQLLRAQMTALVACQVYFFDRSAEVHRELLQFFPDTPVLLADMAGVVRNVFNESSHQPAQTRSRPLSAAFAPSTMKRRMSAVGGSVRHIIGRGGGEAAPQASHSKAGQESAVEAAQRRQSDWASSFQARHDHLSRQRQESMDSRASRSSSSGGDSMEGPAPGHSPPRQESAAKLQSGRSRLVRQGSSCRRRPPPPPQQATGPTRTNERPTPPAPPHRAGSRCSDDDAPGKGAGSGGGTAAVESPNPTERAVIAVGQGSPGNDWAGRRSPDPGDVPTSDVLRV